jgi:hypothetical protein
VETAFQDVTHPKLAPDLFAVDRLALVGKGGARRDDEAIVDAREIGCQIIGNGVSDILLLGIVAEIGKRQHDDGQAMGRRLRSRIKIPSGAADNDQQNHRQHNPRY